MHIPVIAGIIRRRLLVNFRAAPEVVQRILPAPFRPKLHKGQAIVGVCLIRLEHIRPAGWPEFVGINSENAAHRIAVEWTDPQAGVREGVFIPRRDTGSLLNVLAGGRIFPGEHHAAHFEVRDDGIGIDLRMESRDKSVKVRVIGRVAATLPAASCFKSVAEASKFFEGGSVGFSVVNGTDRLDGLRLDTQTWQVSPLEVTEVFASFFADGQKFPAGTVEFDHALVMRDIHHEWHEEADVSRVSVGAGQVQCC